MTPRDAASGFKSTLKSWPLVGPLLLKVQSALRALIGSLVRAFLRMPLLSGLTVRRAIFDAAKPNSFLLSNKGSESFLVSANDRLIGREVFAGGAFDFDKFEKMLALLDRDFRRSLLIDIGANIGSICIPAVKRRLFERAIAFEPEPFNHSLLATNILLNDLGARITPHNLALGAEPGEIAFELSESSFGDHRISVSKNEGLFGEAGRKTIKVRCETLDRIVPDLDPKSTLIWMDTQGFEGFVLKGAQNALGARPPMVIEFWPYGMNRSGAYPLLKQAICQAGYRQFHDLGTDAGPIPVSEQALDDLFRRIGEGGEFTDLLLV